MHEFRQNLFNLTADEFAVGAMTVRRVAMRRGNGTLIVLHTDERRDGFGEFDSKKRTIRQGYAREDASSVLRPTGFPQVLDSSVGNAPA